MVGVVSLAPGVDLDVAIRVDSQFGLLAVLAAVSIECFMVLFGHVRVLHAPYDADTAFAVVALQIASFGCAGLAALVGLLSAYPFDPDRLSAGGVLWVLVSLGVAMLSLAVVSMIPDEIIQQVARERLIRRRSHLVNAVDAWRSEVSVGALCLHLVALCLAPLPGMLIATRSLREEWVMATASRWMLVILVMALWVGVMALDVTSRLLMLALMAPYALLISTCLGLVAAIDVAGSDSPWLTGLGWLLALFALSLFVSIDVAGASTSSWQPQALRRLVRLGIEQDLASTSEAIDLACLCKEQPKMGRLRAWHAKRVGRDVPFPICPVAGHRNRRAPDGEPRADRRSPHPVVDVTAIRTALHQRRNGQRDALLTDEAR